MNPMLRELLSLVGRRALTIWCAGYSGVLIERGLLTAGEADLYIKWLVPLAVGMALEIGYAAWDKYIVKRLKLILNSTSQPISVDTAKMIEKGTRKTGSSVQVNGQIITAEQIPSVTTPDHEVAPTIYLNTGDGTPGSATPAPPPIPQRPERDPGRA